MALLSIHLENGIKKERLKHSEHHEDIEDSLFQKKMIEKKLFMQEFLQKNNLITWITKLNTSNQNIRLMNLSQISDQVLISKEKVLDRFWNNYSQTISKQLWLPLKTGCVDLESSCSNTYFKDLEPDWKFLIPTNMNQMKNSQTACYQSLQILQPNIIAEEITKKK